jgi:hypothetical protein
MRNACVFVALVLMLAYQCAFAAANQRNRVIVLTDIEADPDDTQSLVRLLLYSNEIDIKGLVATTSCWQQTRIAPKSIMKVIQAYGQVHPNLIKHATGFPDAGALLNIVKRGSAKYGMQGVGDGHDSEGSDWIIKVLEEEDERPLWISVWGGVNTLAQALHKIRNTKTKTEAKKLISKLRVYTISDQDDSGIWIRNNFPDLFYIVTPADEYSSATWTGINTFVNGINNDEIGNIWLAQNIQQGHGLLGAAYPDVAWGIESDTPAFLSLIPNGLNDSEHPEWGGWGGRYELYKPSTLGDVFAIGENECREDQNSFGIATGKQAFRVNASWNGEIREISKDVLEVLSLYEDIRRPRLTKQIAFSDMFKTEVLATDNGQEFWLPIQERILEAFKKEVGPVKKVRLYILYFGCGAKNPPTVAVAINEFQAARPKKP